MKILKHGTFYKDHKVFICETCGFTAILDGDNISRKKVNCPECYNEITILLYNEKQLKKLESKIKEEKENEI